MRISALLIAMLAVAVLTASARPTAGQPAPPAPAPQWWSAPWWSPGEWTAPWTPTPTPERWRGPRTERPFGPLQERLWEAFRPALPALTGPIALAEGGGYLFLLRGNHLTKLDGDLEVVTSVPLPEPARRQRTWTWSPPWPGFERETDDAQDTARATITIGGALGMPGATALTATRERVYVVRGEEVLVYDLDLNLIQQTALPRPPTPARPAWPPWSPLPGPAEEPWDRPEAAPGLRVLSLTQSLDAGLVHLAMVAGPQAEAAGFHLWVTDLEGRPAPALVTAYLYPAEESAEGREVHLQAMGPASWAGTLHWLSEEDHTLAVRVARERREDEVVYFPLRR